MFVEFIASWKLREEVAAMSAEQILVLALFHKQMRSRPVARLMASERFDLVRSKPEYVPAALVHSPAEAHFAKIADGSTAASEEASEAAVMQAPVICQLCGNGFLDEAGLWKHAAAEHHSWAEYRKRLIYEVQNRQSIPLQPVEKRRLVGNFMHDLLHSYPSRNSLKPGSCTMRQLVACAVCAGKGWIEDFYPC